MGIINEDINKFNRVGGLQIGVVDPVTVASAAAMPAPKASVTTVSGTVAITTIALPWAGFTGTIKYIPTGIFTATTAGTADGTNMPIGIALTAVVGKVLDLTFDGIKWYPSYLS